MSLNIRALTGAISLGLGVALSIPAAYANPEVIGISESVPVNEASTQLELEPTPQLDSDAATVAGPSREVSQQPVTEESENSGSAPEQSEISPVPGKVSRDKKFVPGEVIITFASDATKREKKDVRIQALGGVESANTGRPDVIGPDVELVSLPRGSSVGATIQDLQDEPGVLAVEPNYLLRTSNNPDDPSYVDGSLWGMYGEQTSPSSTYGSNAASAWASGHTGSDDVYVAVIDEVVDVSHPDLAANVWVNAAEKNGTPGVDDDGNGVIDDIYGFDVINETGIVDNSNAGRHGTHVAGTIGAVGNNGVGVAGVAWDVNLISVGAFRNGSGRTSDVIRALDYVTNLRTQQGLDIVASNNSWAGPGSRALLDAIKRGGDAGILFVAAAGNDAQNNDDEVASAESRFPSAYDCSTSIRSWDCVVSVAAIGADGTLASFSSYGADSVDIGAPGVDIYSTTPTSTGNSYGAMSGTSMATPHVTGAIAMCAAANRGLSQADLKEILLDNAVPTASLTGKSATGGRLDVGAMLPDCISRAENFSGAPSDLTATAYYTDRIRLEWTDNSAG